MSVLSINDITNTELRSRGANPQQPPARRGHIQRSGTTIRPPHQGSHKRTTLVDGDASEETSAKKTKVDSGLDPSIYKPYVEPETKMIMDTVSDAGCFICEYRHDVDDDDDDDVLKGKYPIINAETWDTFYSKICEGILNKKSLRHSCETACEYFNKWISGPLNMSERYKPIPTLTEGDVMKHITKCDTSSELVVPKAVLRILKNIHQIEEKCGICKVKRSNSSAMTDENLEVYFDKHVSQELRAWYKLLLEYMDKTKTQ